MYLQMLYMVPSLGIGATAPEKRGCYYEGEKNLTLFKVHTNLNYSIFDL